MYVRDRPDGKHGLRMIKAKLVARQRRKAAGLLLKIAGLQLIIFFNFC